MQLPVKANALDEVDEVEEDLPVGITTRVAKIWGLRQEDVEKDMVIHLFTSFCNKKQLNGKERLRLQLSFPNSRIPKIMESILRILIFKGTRGPGDPRFQVVKPLSGTIM